jgi:hypothetical protein
MDDVGPTPPFARFVLFIGGCFVYPRALKVLYRKVVDKEPTLTVHVWQ